MEGLSNTLKKEDRLCGFKAIAELFENGKSRLNYPIKLVFLEKEKTQGNQTKAAFSVSKKYYKKATDRNLLKRRMREAYRLNKNIVVHNIPEKYYDLAFIYIANEILPFCVIEKSIIEILSRLVKK